METAAKVEKLNGMADVAKIPTLAELIEHSEDTLKQNKLMVLLNQEPPAKWLKTHPMTKTLYLPIERVEFMLSAIFGKWWVEVLHTSILANSVAATIRLHVINPVTKQAEWTDGVGAAPIQTDSGAGATDWSKVKNAGVQMALPMAKSYALKDAAETLGKLFGKDLNRKDHLSYDSLLTVHVSYEDLAELYELKKDSLSVQETKNAKRILSTKETNSYYKLYKELNSK